jgi:hypothetical protein
MGNAPHMPELKKDLSALRVDVIRHLAPAGDLLGRVDAGRVLIALTFRDHLARFADDQPRARALPVIFDGERRGDVARSCTIARQWRHHDAIGKGQLAEPVRLEESAGEAHVGPDCNVAGYSS